MLITRKFAPVFLFCLLTLFLSACGADQIVPEQPFLVEENAVVNKEELTTDESEAGVNTLDAVQSAESLADQGQEMTFSAFDGTELRGTYYPADTAGAPLIIMMHWAQSDQSDYVELAYWLQNHGLGGKSENPENLPWFDPVWFPQMDTEKTYAVFTFTFRQCEGGCQVFLRDEWLIDAQSAVDFAYGLDAIDKEKIIVVGASIGADGAADGCLYLDQQHPGSCQGSFSLSAGDYLTLSYADVVAQLGEASIPAWCIYAESDVESANVCGVFEAENYSVYAIGDGHGMMLVKPDVDPNPLQLLLDFISDTIG